MVRDLEKNRQYQAEWRARLSKEAKKAHDRARYLRNKEKFNEQSTKWAKENKHKSQAATHQTTVRTKYPEIYEKTDIKTHELASWLSFARGQDCPYCGAPAYHIDHKTPLAKGGSHTWDNIEIICETCNFAKNDHTKEEYIQWINNLVLRQPLLV